MNTLAVKCRVASITVTKSPDKATTGKMVEVRSDQVPTYCNFKE